MEKMKSVVITGSTSGIGLGLAEAFLAQGCCVTISGHSQNNLDLAYDTLERKHDKDRIQAYLCNVTRYEEVEGLWQAAVAKFNHVDIWINNAGTGQSQIPIRDYSHELIDKVVGTNVNGVLYGMKIALSYMKQQGFGSIYNMEGLGSGGPVIRGLALYSATKAAVAYLTVSAAKEAEGTAIIVGGLRPGMVATKLITDQYKEHPEEWKKAERIFSILSDRVETVTPWLADKILRNEKNGVRIQWLTRSKIMFRFLESLFRKRIVYE